jgi:hypothetical protein
MLLSVPKEEGSDPVKEFLEKSRYCKFMRLPISLGKLPEILLSLMLSCINEVERLETELGRTPPNLL